MGSSSQMSDGSSGSFNCYDYGIMCGCNLPVKICTSNTMKNPNRRYLRCPKSMGFQCKFFKWLDPRDSKDIRNLPEVDSAEERQKINMLIGECAKLSKLHESDRNVIRDLEVKLLDLKIVKKKMKKELLFCHIVICILCTLLLSSKLG